MSITSWNVAFIPAERPTHCLAFSFDPATSVWVVIDPATRRTAVSTMTTRVFHRWLRRLAKRAFIVRAEVSDRRPRFTTGWLCVAEIKRLLGFRSGALFPGGLRRDLLRSGARQVFKP